MHGQERIERFSNLVNTISLTVLVDEINAESNKKGDEGNLANNEKKCCTLV